MNESYYHGDNERIAFVVKQMWGDEESELRQNIFASFVVREENMSKTEDDLEILLESSSEARSTGVWQNE